METVKVICFSCCVGFGLVFGGGAALIVLQCIESCAEVTGKFLARILK